MKRDAEAKYTVSQVAALSGVTVRTLHHYDEIGLLTPRERSRVGYRLYDEADLLRLQQILVGRELGLALEEIRQQLDDPKFDHRAALVRQRAELQRRASETAAMLRAIDAALIQLDEADKRQTNLDRKESQMKALFDGFDPEAHADESRQRWGHTDAYQESAKRTKNYGKAEWEQIKVEQAEIYAALAELSAGGVAPDSDAARAAVERHRLSIDRWFYPCSPQMHRNLASLYEQDARFAANIDKYGEGLTTFLVAAIRANGG